MNKRQVEIKVTRISDTHEYIHVALLGHPVQSGLRFDEPFIKTVAAKLLDN